MSIKRPISKQPTPSHAKKVFQGKLFSVYQWEQKLFDGSTTTFEKIARRDTVNVIPVTLEGKILITEQEQPGAVSFIGAPGGIVDEGEDALAAAKRELLEETGYRAQEFVLWFAFQPFDKIEWAIYTFIAKGCMRIKDPEIDAGEKISLVFLSFDEFLKAVSKDTYRDTEVSLRILRMNNIPSELTAFKKLLGV